MELCIGVMETSNLTRRGFEHQNHSWKMGGLETFNLSVWSTFGCEKCAHKLCVLEVQSPGTSCPFRPGGHG